MTKKDKIINAVIFGFYGESITKKYLLRVIEEIADVVEYAESLESINSYLLQFFNLED